MYSPEKPKYPPCTGRQYAGTPDEGSVSPDKLGVSYDQWSNEIAEDRTMHMNTTPGKGSWSFDEGHYSDDNMGGYSSYGVMVEDRGQNPSRSVISVDNSRADRGKDA